MLIQTHAHTISTSSATVSVSPCPSVLEKNIQTVTISASTPEVINIADVSTCATKILTRNDATGMDATPAAVVMPDTLAR